MSTIRQCQPSHIVLLPATLCQAKPASQQRLTFLEQQKHQQTNGDEDEDDDDAATDMLRLRMI